MIVVPEKQNGKQTQAIPGNLGRDGLRRLDSCALSFLCREAALSPLR
jgi:hypothetical protein